MVIFHSYVSLPEGNPAMFQSPPIRIIDHESQPDIWLAPGPLGTILWFFAGRRSEVSMVTPLFFMGFMEVSQRYPRGFMGFWETLGKILSFLGYLQIIQVISDQYLVLSHLWFLWWLGDPPWLQKKRYHSILSHHVHCIPLNHPYNNYIHHFKKA